MRNKQEMIEIGIRIQDVLHDSGLKQGWLAKRVGLTDGTMSDLVHGVYMIDAPTLGKIATILGVTTDYLIYGE